MNQKICARELGVRAEGFSAAVRGRDAGGAVPLRGQLPVGAAPHGAVALPAEVPGGGRRPLVRH